MKSKKGKVSRIPLLKLKLKKKQRQLRPASWNYITDIPNITTVAGPNDSEWPKRRKEEIKVFEKWCAFQSPPFRDLTQEYRRKFSIEANLKSLFNQQGKKKWTKTAIKIPIHYPHYMPELNWRENNKFWRLVRSWTNKKPFCMPPVFKVWWKKKKGHAGIAHFLQAFLAFISVAGEDSEGKGYSIKI